MPMNIGKISCKKLLMLLIDETMAKFNLNLSILKNITCCINSSCDI